MPYVLLVIGAGIGLFGLYKFLVSAQPQQIKSLLLAMILLVLSAALFFMAVTGRLGAAIALVVAIWPVALAWWKAHAPRRKPEAPARAPTQTLTRAEALDILGLPPSADAAAIEEAYKRLMLKVHPDQQGSDWIAAKLNEARDLLLS